jgi:V/A-type H+-transporting ATPase subunit F
MHEMAVIGDRDSVLGFKALGFHVEYVEDATQASRIINRLARERFAVIFVTEKLAMQISETMARYKAAPTPAIIPIPDNRGTNGFGMKGLYTNVEKAIGVNILLDEEGDA